MDPRAQARLRLPLARGRGWSLPVLLAAGMLLAGSGTTARAGSPVVTGRTGMITLDPDLLLGPIAPPSGTSSAGRSDTATGALDPGDETPAERAERLRRKMGRLFMTLLTSPLMVRYLNARLSQVQDLKVRRWVREASYMVDQTVAEAERGGLLGKADLDRAKLFRKTFAEITRGVGTTDRMMVGKPGDARLLRQAEQVAREFQSRSFYGSVSELRASGKLSDARAADLLRMNRVGDLTPRELGAKLLRETSLEGPSVLELMRTWEAKTRDVRVKGMRDSRFDATVLDAMDPWRDPRRTPFTGRLGRDLAARLLTYAGDAPGFEALLRRSAGLTGRDAGLLVDEYRSELRKEAAYRRAPPLAGRSGDGEAPRVPERPAAAPDAGELRFAASTARGEAASERFLAEARKVQGVLDRVVARVPREEYFLRWGSPGVEIVDSRESFAKTDPGGIKISSGLLDRVRVSAGDEGVAFVLGRELANRTLMRAGIGITEPRLTLETDRLGYRWARAAYPDLDLPRVERILQAAHGHGEGIGGRVRRLALAFSNPTRPTEIERLHHLAERFGPDRAGEIHARIRRSAFHAPESASSRRATYVEAARTGGPAAALNTLKTDFLRGGLIANVGIAAGMGLVTGMVGGQGLAESARETGKLLRSPEFLVGNLLGGTLGAVMGSFLSLPASLVAGGAMGTFFSVLPTMALAITGAAIGETMVTLWRRGDLGFRNVLAHLRITETLAQILGASLGVTAASLLLPGPLGGIVGGLLGGLVATRVIRWFQIDHDLLPGWQIPSILGPVPVSGHRPSGTSVPIDAARLAELEAKTREAYRAVLEAQAHGRLQESRERLRRYGSLRSRLDLARAAASAARPTAAGMAAAPERRSR